MLKKFELILISEINALFSKNDSVFLIIDTIFTRAFFNIKSTWFILISNQLILSFSQNRRIAKGLNACF